MCIEDIDGLPSGDRAVAGASGAGAAGGGGAGAIGRRDYLVTVCDSCMRACCWHGVFYCENYQTAGTKDISASELRKLNAEHSSYYTRKELMRVCGQEALQ